MARKGWHGESARHSLAARGMKTGRSHHAPHKSKEYPSSATSTEQHIAATQELYEEATGVEHLIKDMRNENDSDVVLRLFVQHANAIVKECGKRPLDGAYIGQKIRSLKNDLRDFGYEDAFVRSGDIETMTDSERRAVKGIQDYSVDMGWTVGKLRNETDADVIVRNLATNVAAIIKEATKRPVAGDYMAEKIRKLEGDLDDLERYSSGYVEDYEYRQSGAVGEQKAIDHQERQISKYETDYTGEYTRGH